jgi:MFS family permease
VARASDTASPAASVTFWLSLIGVVAIAIYGTTPPRALDETASADQFSAARAKAHLQEIAREPHPIGSAANHRVRDYLIEQLRGLGAEVQLEETVGVTDGRRQIYAGTAQNIFGVIKGTANSRAVMLASHYDSVPEAPGAADAGAGLVAILETVRALKATGPLKNDLLLLFTDGEEEGLIGAAGFVRDHPELKERVGVVLNFEARGSSGPAMMFETSEENGWLTREFARAAPYPFASSLAYAVYKNLPNQTDMTVFKKAGLAGLNFAFTATFENYHTRRDTPENLDARSLQNLGANALALTRHFGNLELRAERERDRVYFNWFGSRLIDYPQWVAWPLLVLVFVLLLAVVSIGRRRGKLTITRTLLGFGGFVLVLLAALAGAHLLWWLVGVATERLLVGDTWSNTLLVIACLTAGVAFVIRVQAWLASGLGAHNAATGQLLAVAILAAVLTYLLPAASYVLQWPLIFALAGVLAALMMKQTSTLPAFLGSLPALLIFAPLMYLLFVTLGFDVIAVSVLAVLLGVLVALLAPLLPEISRPLRVSMPILLVCSAALFLTGVRMTRFSAEHPRRHSLLYAVNTDEQKAAWVSYDNALDDWTRQFLTNEPARGKAPAFTIGSGRDTLSRETQLLPLEAPTATVISDTASEGRRALKLHLASPRGANGLLMRLPGDVQILAVTINGQQHQILDRGTAGTPWLLRYNALPAGGVEVELQLAGAAPFTCWLGDRSFGLPEVPGQSYQPRPPDLMPTYGSDVTLTSRLYRF